MIKVDCRLIEGKSAHSIIEEEIYRLFVKFEDQSFQKVDKVIKDLLVFWQLWDKVMLDQLRHEGAPEQEK